jgi:hypothetical protein
MSSNINLQKKREKIRRKLRDLNILPPFGNEPNKEQQDIIEQISNNDFSYYIKLKELKRESTKKEKIEKEKVKKIKKEIKTEKNRVDSRKMKIIDNLISLGILPPLGTELNPQQQEILEYVNENYKLSIKSFIVKYKHLSTPEFNMWYKTKLNAHKNKNKKQGESFFNISVEDIIIPKYCPYLGVELITDKDKCNHPNYYTIDRIDSSKGYVKGNIQIISFLSNIMKNNATIDELLTFSHNVIKLHTPK